MDLLLLLGVGCWDARMLRMAGCLASCNGVVSSSPSAISAHQRILQGCSCCCCYCHSWASPLTLHPLPHGPPTRRSTLLFARIQGRVFGPVISAVVLSTIVLTLASWASARCLPHGCLPGSA